MPGHASSHAASSRTRAQAGRSRAVLPVVATLLALAGCGGSSSTPTKAQYIAKVNAVCATELQQLDQVALSKTKLLAKVSEAIQIREQALAKIEAVKSPSSDPISPDWLSQRRRALVATKKIASSKLGAAEARTENAAFVASFNRALSIGRAYGLSSCRGFAAV